MPPHDLTTRDRRLATLLVGLLAVVAFLPSLRNGFVYDDEKYILQNPLIASWSWEHLRAILTQPYFGNFHPLHLLAYALERTAFGLRPMGWHAVSVALHAVNAMLLYRLLPRFGVGPAVALAGAAIFAVHPVQAESVAWVSEQKSLLSLLFTFLCLQAYLTARASGRPIHVALSTLAFLSALASKVQAVGAIPFLLALEVLNPPALGRGKGSPLTRLLPLLVLFGTWTNLAIIAHGKAHYIKLYPGGSLLTTVLSIGPILFAYGRNLLWPTGLAIIYDLPPANEMVLAVLLAQWIVVFGIGILLIELARRERERRIALGLIWIAGFLLPVLNFVPISTLLNDRYLYAPLCAIGPMAVYGAYALAGALVRRGLLTVPTWTATVTACAVVVMLGWASGVRSSVWYDTERLWSEAVKKSPRSEHAHYNLGTYWMEKGRYDLAERELHAAMEADPNRPNAYQNLGGIHFRQKRYRLAAAELKAATRIDSQSYALWMNLALVQGAAGRWDEALKALDQALRLRPRATEPYYSLGFVRVAKGDRQGGIQALVKFLGGSEGTPASRRLAEEQLRRLKAQDRNSREASRAGTNLAREGRQ